MPQSNENPVPSVWLEPSEGGFRFEVISRGDWVPGRLFLPEGKGPFPLILVLHGAGGSKDDEVMNSVTGPWVAGGAAIARIDLPLHGERHDPKLSARVLGAMSPGAAPSPLDLGLWADLHTQAVADLTATATALGARDDIAGDRLGFAGFSLGAILGTAFCAHDSRVGAAALAFGGGGLAPSPFDATDFVAGIAPRPVLFVNVHGDQRIPKDRAVALHDAAQEPKQVAWFDGGHGELPGVALKQMWRFLADSIGL